MSMRMAGVVTVRCFHGDGADGSLHQVILPEALNWTSQRALDLSIDVAPATVVLIRSQRHITDTPLHSLEYFHNGHAVLRCGSGSVAAAKALSGLVQTPIDFYTAAGSVQVVGGDGNLLGYKIAALPYARAPCVQRWQGVIDRKLGNVVLVGGEQDYCLLELQSQSALQQCRINARRLALISKRALIVTARADDATHDYALRYFSPQYGQYEDSATGSAHAMAAAFWQSRLSKSRIRGIQLSVAGGEFCVQRQGLSQCVFGRTEVCGPAFPVRNSLPSQM